MSTGTDPKPTQPAASHEAVTPKKRRYSLFDYAREQMKGQEVPTFPKLTAPYLDPKYTGKWLAISADLTTVIGVGDTIEEASQEAERERPDEEPSFIHGRTKR